MWESNFLQTSPLHHCGWKKNVLFYNHGIISLNYGMATIIMAARSYKFCHISRMKENETSLSSMCKAAIPHIFDGQTHIHTRLP